MYLQQEHKNKKINVLEKVTTINDTVYTWSEECKEFLQHELLQDLLKALNYIESINYIEVSPRLNDSIYIHLYVGPINKCLGFYFADGQHAMDLMVRAHYVASEWGNYARFDNNKEFMWAIKQAIAKVVR